MAEQTSAYAATLVLSTFLLWTSWRRPDRGRLLFVLLFFWAALFNWRVSSATPEVYQYFGRTAVLPWYRDFISGPFARHASAVVGSIAAGQLLVAALLACRKPWVFGGRAGGILFLLAISPLGSGSAFPSTLIMAAGLAMIWRKRPEKSLPAIGVDLWRRARSVWSGRRGAKARSAPSAAKEPSTAPGDQGQRD